MKISPLAPFYLLSLTTFGLLVLTQSAASQSKGLTTAELSSSVNKADNQSTYSSLLNKILMRPTHAPIFNETASSKEGLDSASSKSEIQNEIDTEDDYTDNQENVEDDDDGDDEEEEEEGEEDNEEDDEFTTDTIRDLLENKLDLNQTISVARNTARDLGLLTLKAIILGPLIGLTIKAALIRGLFWAVGAYLLHLFFPGLLAALGLGSGLVGFARQMQPNYPQMLAPLLIELENSLPAPVTNMISQCRQAAQPLLESIRPHVKGAARPPISPTPEPIVGGPK